MTQQECIIDIPFEDPIRPTVEVAAHGSCPVALLLDSLNFPEKMCLEPPIPNVLVGEENTFSILLGSVTGCAN